MLIEPNLAHSEGRAGSRHACNLIGQRLTRRMKRRSEIGHAWWRSPRRALVLVHFQGQKLDKFIWRCAKDVLETWRRIYHIFLVMLLSKTVNIMRACRVMNIYTLLLPHRLLHSDPEDPYDWLWSRAKSNLYFCGILTSWLNNLGAIRQFDGE